METDAYFIATALPFTIVGVLTSTFSFVLVPILAQYKNDNGNLLQLINRLLTIIILVAVFVFLFGEICGGLIVKMTTPHLSLEKLKLATSLTPVIWITVSFTLLSSFVVGLYHFYKRFVTPAISLLLSPICMIIAGLLFASKVGIKSIVIGSAIGSVLQFFILFKIMVINNKFEFSLSITYSEIKKIFFPVIPVSISLLPFTILPFIDVFWTSRFPDGAISYLGYASKIIIAITGIIIQGTATVLLPIFSDDAANGVFTALKDKILKAIRITNLFTVPIVVICIVLRTPLLEVLFQRGSFTKGSTANVGSVLPFYLIAMIGLVPMNILNRGFYSLRAFRTSAKIGLILVAFYILMCGLLIPHFSYLGIGIAYAIYWNVAFIFYGFVLGRKIGHGKFWNNSDVVFGGKVAIVAIITGLLITPLWKWISIIFGSLPGMVISAGAGVCIVIFFYFFVFKFDEIALLKKALIKEAKA
jgi:putative peptidoglycan lipid II flippase